MLSMFVPVSGDAEEGTVYERMVEEEQE